MPVRQGRAESRLIRLVVGKRGTVAMRAELIVRFGYGGWTPWVTRSENGDLVWHFGLNFDIASLLRCAKSRHSGCCSI